MTKQNDAEATSDENLDEVAGGKQQGRPYVDAEFNESLSSARKQETHKRSGVINKKLGMSRTFFTS
ncbi:MAG: hypothetical protein AAGH74_17295 [Pseudomonadota bacterium]